MRLKFFLLDNVFRSVFTLDIQVLKKQGTTMQKNRDGGYKSKRNNTRQNINKNRGMLIIQNVDLWDLVSHKMEHLF